MKTPMQNILLIAVVFITIAGCDHWDQKLTIVNEASDTIFVAIPLDGYFKEFPIKIDRGDTLWTHTRFVTPGDSTKPLSVEGMSWEETINKKSNDSTLTVFVFEKDLLKSISADSLLSNQLYSEKYSYTVKDLEELNWRIVYKE